MQSFLEVPLSPWTCRRPLIFTGRRSWL
ncbi:unnamed protein product [Tetraodon nigroviridis]|uniref:(spotted green pufferfish) hypothetical protein n=1 Tax=Tetraodon nigroviridis TaxID=99883 RepID=Q4SKW5_TETNG|nr:unnamed protein product [Tetraodon nigroviridis]